MDIADSCKIADNLGEASEETKNCTEYTEINSCDFYDSVTEVPDKNTSQNINTIDCSLCSNCDSTHLTSRHASISGLKELEPCKHSFECEIQGTELLSDADGKDCLHQERSLENTLSKSEIPLSGLNFSNVVDSTDTGEHTHFKFCTSIQKAVDEDAKLRCGCFIKLVDCQVFLKSMMASPEVTPKPKKRKLNDGTSSRKCKIKKSGNNDLGQVSQGSLTHVALVTSNNKCSNSVCNSTTYQNDVDMCEKTDCLEAHGIVDKNLNIAEGKNNLKTLSSNDSNIFTNMTSFLLSGTSSEKHEPSSVLQSISAESDLNAVDNHVLQAQQPIVRLVRLPFPSGNESDECPDVDQGKFQKLEYFLKGTEKTCKKHQITEVDILKKMSKDGEHQSFSDSLKDEKATQIREKKSAKVYNLSKKDKKKHKSIANKGLESKNSFNESKKLKTDEAMKKLQDVIGIKPIVSQGLAFVKRIPKINQSSSDNSHSKSLLDLDRKDHLEWGTLAVSSQSVQNQLKDAGWTGHSRFPKADRSSNLNPSLSKRNFNWDRQDYNYQKSDFATPDRKSFNDARKSYDKYQNGNCSQVGIDSRYSGRNEGFRRESQRSRGLQRPALLPSPQNYNNISSDVQFLLKACNAIVDSNSNLSSEHQQQFNSACDRLRDELEKLMNSSNSTPFNSPGSKGAAGNSSFKDFSIDEIMGLLKSHLPLDVYERLCKDIPKSGNSFNLGERLNPISPQSSASSTSYKDPTHLSCLLPKNFIPNSKDSINGLTFDNSKSERGRINNRLIAEEQLLKTIEKEIKIIETLVRVQDQLSVPDFDKTDGHVSNSPVPPVREQNTDNSSFYSMEPQLINSSKCPKMPQLSERSPETPFAVPLGSSTPHAEQINNQNEFNNNQSKDHNHLSDDKGKHKKLMEKIISFSRNALKSYYHKGNITSEEFKCIMKKAITKISESKCKDVSQPKVTRFIDSLVSNVISKRRKINS